MRKFIFILSCVFCVNVTFAQYLSIDQLQKILNAKDFDAADLFVQNLDWELSSSSWHYIVYGYAMSYDRQRAEGWLHLMYDDKVNNIDYQFFDSKDFAKLRSCITSKGWKSINTDSEKGKVTYKYYSNGYYYVLSQEVETDSDNDEREMVRYRCRIYKKGSFEDDDNGEKYFYDNDDNTRERVMYADGKRNGSYRKEKWDSEKVNYVLIVKGQYTNDEKSGLWEYYDLDGNKTRTTNYSRGKKTGLENFYYYGEDGKLIGKGVATYINGELEGESYLSDLKDKKILIRNYGRGKKQGKYMSLTDKALIVRSYKDDKREGYSYTYFYEDARMFPYTDYQYDYQQLDTGNEDLYYIFTQEGKQLYDTINNLRLSVMAYYKDGKLQNRKKYYYNGDNVIMEIGGYNADEKKDGVWKQYYGTKADDKYIRSICNYKNGELNGASTYFWEGDASSKGMSVKGFEISYQNGLKSGEYKLYNSRYDENGYYIVLPDGDVDLSKTSWVDFQLQGNYLDGQKTGKWYRIANGTDTTSVENYLKGDLNGQSVYYYGDTTVYAMYKNGKNDGDYKRYVGSELIDWITYANGQIHGSWKSFNHGKIIAEYIYDKGLKVEDKFYDVFGDHSILSYGYENNKLISKKRTENNLYIKIYEYGDSYYYEINKPQHISQYVAKKSVIKDKLTKDFLLCDFDEALSILKTSCVYTFAQQTQHGNLRSIDGTYLSGSKSGIWTYYLKDEKEQPVNCKKDYGTTNEMEVYSTYGKPYSGKIRFDQDNYYEVICVKKGLRNGRTEMYDYQGNLITIHKYSKGVRK